MKHWFALALAFMLLALPAAGVSAQDDEATTVAVAESDTLGEYLTDAEGMTLYLFTRDTEPNVSTCYDDCAQAWPPFSAEEPLTLPEGVEGELTTFDRDDGTTQVAYNGIPLYYWQGDESPGDTTGHDVGGVWFVVQPGQEMAAVASPVASPMASDEAATTIMVASDAELGEYFTDAEGRALYMFTNDTEPGRSTCTGGCAENWPIFTAEEPLTLPEGVEGELTLIEREDGTTQVAYNGMPLYYWQGDQSPGQATGHRVGGVWFVVAPGTQHGEIQPEEE
jgi:predicted lipoprotein with Yx(FWY)xxD motif